VKYNVISLKLHNK